MADETTGQPQVQMPNSAPDQVDPKSQLHVGMRVLGGHGKALGKVETLERDNTSGQLQALVVRHGLFKNQLTSVPAGRVKWVNADSVILDLAPAMFKKLPKVAVS
jgi:sporulation protein YlmC with PRC-barrel domain